MTPVCDMFRNTHRLGVWKILHEVVYRECVWPQIKILFFQIGQNSNLQITSYSAGNTKLITYQCLFVIQSSGDKRTLQQVYIVFTSLSCCT